MKAGNLITVALGYRPNVPIRVTQWNYVAHRRIPDNVRKVVIAKSSVMPEI